MSRIKNNLFLSLWDEIIKREWMTDRALCGRVDIAPSTISRIRSRHTKAVQPELVRRIGDTMNYEIELAGSKWKIKKRLPGDAALFSASALQEASAMREHYAGTSDAMQLNETKLNETKLNKTKGSRVSAPHGKYANV